MAVSIAMHRTSRVMNLQAHYLQRHEQLHVLANSKAVRFCDPLQLRVMPESMYTELQGNTEPESYEMPLQVR